MSRALPELLIEGGPRLRLGQALRELFAFRGTIVAFAQRDVQIKYRQAALGFAWAVLQPLAFMTIFALMLGRLAGVPGGGAPYAAFSLSALVAWAYIQNAVSFGASALLKDGALVRKVYFPREVPVLGAVVAAGVDFAIGLGLFMVIGPFLGARFSLTWLLAPVLGLTLGILAAGVALFVAAFNVYYSDFRYALPFALQLWLFASPVAYPLDVVPEPWRGLYVALNPAAGVLDGFRRVLALGELPDPGLLAVSFTGALVVLFGAYWVFKRIEPNFAEVI
jgi:ABC-type polysaccharide/polyol phosphate export permease